MSINKLTINTPIEQLYNFYKNNPEKRGGVYTQALLFDKFTVDEYDKFWVFEKLINNNILVPTGMILNDQSTYGVNQGVDKVLKWMIEKENV